jgi:hypothetical protein
MYTINTHPIPQQRAIHDSSTGYDSADCGNQSPSPTSELGLPLIPAQHDASLATMTREAIIACEAHALGEI